MSQSSQSSFAYPRTATLSLRLEVLIPDSDTDSYLFASPSESEEVLQIGFLADLLDMFDLETALRVKRVNGFTKEQLGKALAQAAKIL